MPETRQPTLEPLDQRDVESGLASGQVQGTPTLFIDGSVHRAGYDAATLMDALGR
jgi:hypothetical protein